MPCPGYTLLKEYVRQTAHNHTEEIIFGTSPSSSRRILPAISEFSPRYPHIHLRYVEAWDNVLLDMLKEKKLDIAMVLAPKGISISGIRFVPIFEDRICALVGSSDPLAQKERLQAADLKDRQLIFSSPNASIKQMAAPVLADLIQHTLDLADKNIRMPMIRNGAVGFSLYKHQIKRNHTDVCAILLEPDIEAMFCFAVSDQKRLSREKEAFLKIGERVLVESLEKGL